MGNSMFFKTSAVTLALATQFLVTACTTQGRVEDLRLKNQVIEKQVPIEVPIKVMRQDSLAIEIEKITEQQVVRTETELKEARLLALKTLLDAKDEKLSEASAKLYMLSFSSQQKGRSNLSDAERAQNLSELLAELKPLMNMAKKPRTEHEGKILPTLMRNLNVKVKAENSSMQDLIGEVLKLDLAAAAGGNLNADQASLEIVKANKSLLQYFLTIRQFDLNAQAIVKVKGLAQAKKGSKSIRILNLAKLDKESKKALLESLVVAEKERLSLASLSINNAIDKKLLKQLSNITLDGKKLSVAGNDLFANLILKLQDSK